jgi:hypothetical protein
MMDEPGTAQLCPVAQHRWLGAAGAGVEGMSL